MVHCNRLSANTPLILFVITLLSTAVFSSVNASSAQRDGMITICSNGCDFITIQEAIDHKETVSGAILLIDDPIHTEGGILVAKNIIIQGHGPTSTIVQAANSMEEAEERVFTIAKDAVVTIKQMTIRYGHPLDDPWSGGGIRNQGNLTLDECVVTHNIGSAGGGIWSDGTLKLVNSTVSHNQTMGGRSHVECNGGGGIKGLEGTMTLINSTVSNNTALGKGAGFHVACKSTLVLINSTISGNQTNYDGGGVYLNGVGEFINSTIAYNRAKNGGGVYINGSKEEGVVYGLLNFSNTIIADNLITFEKYGTIDCMIGEDALIGTNHNNLVEDGSCEAAFSGDPGLAPLAENGGKTRSHLPDKESLVVDALPQQACLVGTDQREMPRPSGNGCDIGAVELQTEANSGLFFWVTVGQILLALFVWVIMHYRKQAKVDKDNTIRP